MDDLIRRGDALKELHGECICMPYNGLTDKDAKRAINRLPAVNAVEVTGNTKRALELIVEERSRQVRQWGDQDRNHPFEWMSIIGEEFGELCRAVNETCFQNPKNQELGGRDAIISEAVQVAAVATAIIEQFVGQNIEKVGDGIEKSRG